MGPVCEECWERVPWYQGPLCATCGARLPTGVVCRCADRPPHLSSLACAADYAGPLPAIVQAFKYGGHQSLAAPLAHRLALHPQLHLDAADLIVAVPLHPWRRVVRGFNQADRIARALGRTPISMLARFHRTPPQAGLTAAVRRRNLRGTIRLMPRLTAAARERQRATLRGARVLLVDDVVTTGATLSACAEVLREAGARDVRAATVARTPPPGHQHDTP